MGLAIYFVERLLKGKEFLCLEGCVCVNVNISVPVCRHMSAFDHAVLPNCKPECSNMASV